MARAGLHRAQDRHVLEEALAVLGEVSVADVAVLADAPAGFSKVQDAVVLLARTGQAIVREDVVWGDDGVEAVIALPPAFQKPVNQESRLRLARDRLRLPRERGRGLIGTPLTGKEAEEIGAREARGGETQAAHEVPPVHPVLIASRLRGVARRGKDLTFGHGSSSRYDKVNRLLYHIT